MRVVHWLLAVSIVLCLSFVHEGVVFGQSQEPSQTGETVQAVTGLEQEGEISAVDTDQRFFLIVGENGSEMLFHYDDQTQVIGQSEGVQGLTGQDGTWVQVQYRAEGDRAIAEQIELRAQQERSENPDNPEENPNL